MPAAKVFDLRCRSRNAGRKTAAPPGMDRFAPPVGANIFDFFSRSPTLIKVINVQAAKHLRGYRFSNSAPARLALSWSVVGGQLQLKPRAPGLTPFGCMHNGKNLCVMDLSPRCIAAMTSAAARSMHVCILCTVRNLHAADRCRHPDGRTSRRGAKAQSRRGT